MAAEKFISVLEYRRTKVRGVIANRPTGNQITINQQLIVWGELVEFVEGKKEPLALVRAYLANGTSVLAALVNKPDESIFAGVARYSDGRADEFPIFVNRNLVLSISPAGSIPSPNEGEKPIGLFLVRTAINSFITDNDGRMTIEIESL